MVALHEADWGLEYGSLAALDRLLSVFADYSKANGIDLFVGRRLPRMLQAAGLVDVQVNSILQVCPLGNPRRMLLLEFAKNLRDRILSQGLIPEAEFNESIAALKLYLEDPASLVLSLLYIQAWGRKP